MNEYGSDSNASRYDLLHFDGLPPSLNVKNYRTSGVSPLTRVFFDSPAYQICTGRYHEVGPGGALSGVQLELCHHGTATLPRCWPDKFLTHERAGWRVAGPMINNQVMS